MSHPRIPHILARLLVSSALALGCSTPAVGTEPDGAGLDGSAHADAPSPDGSRVDANGPCPDGDGDGHASAACGGDDCADGDADRYPGNVETCDSMHDEDCDPATLGTTDADSDGFVSAACCNPSGAGMRCGDDCDDTMIGVHVDAPEVCNGRDDDCDTSTDEGVAATFYRDADADGYGDRAQPIQACALPSGYSTLDTDCDDTTPARHPGASEACNIVSDEDCNPSTRPFDVDGDMHDAVGCGGDDCDDADASAHPGAAEICDGRDTDCSSGGGALPAEDADGDMHSPAGAACTGGYPLDDCDDASAARHGGATEICDAASVDEDCDPSTFGADDTDGDGHSASCCNRIGSSAPVCGGDDCEPADATVAPGRTETCDGLDQDCDWRIDEGLTGCSSARRPDGVHANPCDCGGSTPVCCIDNSDLVANCVAAGASCLVRQGRFACDGAEDCPTGTVCVSNDGANTLCSSSGVITLCNDHGDCATGHLCGGPGALAPFACN